MKILSMIDALSEKGCSISAYSPREIAAHDLN